MVRTITQFGAYKRRIPRKNITYFVQVIDNKVRESEYLGIRIGT